MECTSFKGKPLSLQRHKTITFIPTHSYLKTVEEKTKKHLLSKKVYFEISDNHTDPFSISSVLEAQKL